MDKDFNDRLAMKRAKDMRRSGVAMEDIPAKLRKQSASDVARAKKEAARTVEAAQMRHEAVMTVCAAMDKVFNGVMTLDLDGKPQGERV